MIVGALYWSSDIVSEAWNSRPPNRWNSKNLNSKSHLMGQMESGLLSVHVRLEEPLLGNFLGSRCVLSFSWRVGPSMASDSVGESSGNGLGHWGEF